MQDGNTPRKKIDVLSMFGQTPAKEEFYVDDTRNLVVVRCGDHSLHRGWMRSPRNWSLAVSYFGVDEERQFPEADHVHRYRGGKWDGLYDFFLSYPDLLNRYDYVWLPDDDIKAESENINLMFRCMAENEFELAQPSLSPESFLSHLVVSWNPLFEYRNVNLVEIMAPVLVRDLLCRVLPLFKGAKTGFGIDFVWHRFTSDPLSRVAVIDRVQVTHTRPVGGALHKMLAREGTETADQEQARFLARYTDVVKTELITGGRLRNGVRIRSSWLAATLAAVGWALHSSGRRGFVESLSPTRFLVWVVRNWYGNITETRRCSRIMAVPDPEASRNREFMNK